LQAQLARLKQTRAKRSSAQVDDILDKLTKAASNPAANLLELSIEAMRRRATVGEVSAALEKVFGRYRAETQVISNVYSSAYKKDDEFEKVRTQTAGFAKSNGRRPRILVVKLGQDGHDRGAKVIATGFADLGFDVDIGPLFQTPEEAARQAVENDVHVVGISSQAAGHKTLVPALIAELKKLKAAEIAVVVGGIIPAQDFAFLEQAGVAAIFPPGTTIPNAASTVLKVLCRPKK